YWPTTFATGHRTDSDPKRDGSDKKFIVKLTAAPSRPVRAEAFVSHGANYVTGSNASPFVAPEALSVVDQPETMWNARLLWTLNSHTVVELQHGGHNLVQDNGPATGQRLGSPGHL